MCMEGTRVGRSGRENPCNPGLTRDSFRSRSHENIFPPPRVNAGLSETNTKEIDVPTLGIHVIWTCYGTWMPGDPTKRGHWSPLFDLYGRLRETGSKLNLPDQTTYEIAKSRMKESIKNLTLEEQGIVAEELARHLAPVLAGGPTVHAAAIEQDHVHLLLGPVRERIDRCVGRLKGRTSSELLCHPDNWDRKRTWTSGYWKVYLFDDDAMRAVARYIEKHNERRGLPLPRFGWVRPLD